MNLLLIEAVCEPKSIALGFSSKITFYIQEH